MTDDLLTDLREFLGDDLHAFAAYEGDTVDDYYVHDDLEGLLDQRGLLQGAERVGHGLRRLEVLTQELLELAHDLFG